MLNSKDMNMTEKFNLAIAPSRRQILKLAASSAVALITAPFGFRSAFAGNPAGSAITFDGDTLLVAQDTSIWNNPNGKWDRLPNQTSGEILTLATHPVRPNRIVAGLARSGVALSEDGGKSWLPRNNNLPEAPVTALAFSASQPETLYAALKGDGLWKSEDAGASWSFAMDRPWLEDAERNVFSLASVDLATGMGGIWIYAGTEMGLTRVPDCFCRWQDVQAGDAMDALVSGVSPITEVPLPQGEPIYSLISAASTPSKLFAALQSGIWASEDAGVIWEKRSIVDARAIAVHPKNAKHLAALTEDGVIQSQDGGITWATILDLQGIPS